MVDNKENSHKRNGTSRSVNSTNEQKELTMTKSNTNKNDQSSNQSMAKEASNNNSSAESLSSINDNKIKSYPSKIVLLFSVFLAIAIACLAFFVYQSYLSNQVLKKELALLQKQKLDNVDPQQLNQTIVLVKENQEQIAQIIGAQQIQEAQLQKMTQTFVDIDRQNINDWVIIEAHYLVKLASRKLSLEQDVAGAIKLLLSANKNLSAINNPALLEARKALAQDITNLQTMKGVDRDGLVLGLLALQKQVESLPSNARLVDESELPKLEVSKDVRDWKENLSISFEQFMNSFIVIRKHDGDAPQLLSPEQHGYLQENIRAKLDLATKAVYAQNEQLYQASLKTIQEWSGQYLQQSSGSVKAFNSAIVQLQEQNVTLELPKELSALEPLNNWVSKRLPQYAVGEGE